MSPRPFPTTITITYVIISVITFQSHDIYTLAYECVPKYTSWRVLHNRVANVQDGDIVVSEFELRLRYYVHFWINTVLIGRKTPAMC